MSSLFVKVVWKEKSPGSWPGLGVRLSKPKITTKHAADGRWLKFLRYFDANAPAGNMLRGWIAAGCDLQTIGILLRNAILGGPALYEARRKRRDRTEANLKCAIKGFAAAADFYRDWGERDNAARVEAEKKRFEELRSTAKENKAFDTRRLGRLKAKEAPVALIVLVEIDGYITAKTGTPPSPQEMAWLVEAILGAFDRPTQDVDPNILAMRLKHFRECNPHLAAALSSHAQQI